MNIHTIKNTSNSFQPGGGEGGGGGGEKQGLGPRNDVLTTCKAIRLAAVLRKGGKIFRSNKSSERSASAMLNNRF